MTTERVSPETQELRDFVDALRVWLGMRPLYFAGPEKTNEERFYMAPAPLLTSDRNDWFEAKAGATSTRNSFRDESVARAMKRKALNFHKESV